MAAPVGQPLVGNQAIPANPVPVNSVPSPSASGIAATPSRLEPSQPQPQQAASSKPGICAQINGFFKYIGKAIKDGFWAFLGLFGCGKPHVEPSAQANPPLPFVNPDLNALRALERQLNEGNNTREVIVGVFGTLMTEAVQNRVKALMLELLPQEVRESEAVRNNPDWAGSVIANQTQGYDILAENSLFRQAIHRMIEELAPAQAPASVPAQQQAAVASN